MINKDEKIGAFRQLAQAVNKSPKLQTYLYMWLWNMLEDLPEEKQERWEDI